MIFGGIDSVKFTELQSLAVDNIKPPFIEAIDKSELMMIECFFLDSTNLFIVCSENS